MHKKKSNEPTPKGRRAGVKPDSSTCASKERFLNFLRVTGRIHCARLKARGVATSRLKKWRQDSEFESQVQEAIELANELKRERLEEAIEQRAVEGRSRPIYHYSKKKGEAVKVGEEKIPSDLLLMFRMKRLDPRYKDSSKIDVNVPAPTSTYIVLPDSRVFEPTRQGNSNVILVPPQSPKSSQTADIEILERQWKQQLQDRKQDNSSTNNIVNVTPKQASDESQKPSEPFALVDSAGRTKPNGKGE